MKKRKIQILVIDDSYTNNLLIQDILKENGYKPLTTENGRTSIKLISKEFPDLVLLDIIMPEMDGYMVLEQILKKRNVPVIMLSAKTNKEDIQKAFDLGASDYIIKPIIIDELLKKIETALAKIEIPEIKN